MDCRICVFCAWINPLDMGK